MFFPTLEGCRHHALRKLRTGHVFVLFGPCSYLCEISLTGEMILCKAVGITDVLRRLEIGRSGLSMDCVIRLLIQVYV